MRIRTQLIIAAIVLSVIPLAAIVTWSYHSSRRALESAYRSQAERLTGQMDRRLRAIRADLDSRLTVVSALSLPDGEGEEMGDIVSVMGESAALVDALEFQPVRTPKPPAPKAARSEPSPKAASVPEPRPAPVRTRTVRVEERTVPVPDETPEVAARPAVAPAPPALAVPAAPAVAAVAPVAPFTIDIPQVRVVVPFVFSEEQKELIEEISALGTKLAQPGLANDERQDLTAEMRVAQAELRKLVDVDRERRQTEVREAMRHVQRQNWTAHREAVEKARLAGIVPPPPSKPAAPAAEVPAKTKAGAVAPRPEPAAEARVTPPDAKRTEDLAAKAKQASLILGRKFAAPVREEGEVVGQLTAQIRPEQVIRRVLGGDLDGDEIPFAIDREWTIYARTPEEREKVERLGIMAKLRRGEAPGSAGGWIVSMTTDPPSGLRIGVARPVGDNLDELRRTAARNFGLGLGLVAFALIGIVPLSNHLARDVRTVTEGAERIAHGDLMTRLPVKSDNELGQLARAFNRMAADLSSHQQQLLEQERARKEQEMQQHFLSLEYERKSVELEDARRFQLSLLPKEVPQFGAFDVAVYTRTATEVGGDYYDFHRGHDVLSIAIGDATGHGATAGTMVTVVKTLFAGYDGHTSPARFLGDASERIKRMDLGRMAMALSLARFEPRRMTVASAGMPPVLVHRAATGDVEEIALEATPLGTLGTAYPEASVELHEHDTVLFMSDGFPELMNDAGQQLGYGGTMDAFVEAARAPSAQGVIASLNECARRWHGDAPPNDDVTFVALRV